LPTLPAVQPQGWSPDPQTTSNLVVCQP